MMESAQNILDQFVWNEQSEIVDALFPDAEAQYPEIAQWYELKANVNAAVMQQDGAVILQYRTHTWIGCPEGVSIREYLENLATRTSR